MNQMLVLKAISDETRMKIIKLLLQHSYCVRALSNKLNISEAAVSQHLKILREAGLLTGEKNGHFTHYHVERSMLQDLAIKIENLAKANHNNSPQAQEDFSHVKNTQHKRMQTNQ